jgi:hypothetical protein
MTTLFRSLGVSTADSYADDTFDSDMPLTPPSTTAARAFGPFIRATSPSAAAPQQLCSPQVPWSGILHRQRPDYSSLSMALPAPVGRRYRTFVFRTTAIS